MRCSLRCIVGFQRAIELDNRRTVTTAVLGVGDLITTASRLKPSAG